MSRNTLLMSGAAAAVVVAALAFGFGGSGGTETATGVSAASANTNASAPETETAVTPASPPSETAEPIVVAQANAAEDGEPTSLAEKGYALGDIIIGDPDAPVTVIEYASLTCPHCASFHNEVLPELTERYIDTGKVNMIVREVFFDQFGLYATAVARCGGEAAYERYLNVFFKRQAEWSRGASQDEVVNAIRRIGRMGGLPPERVDSCLTDQAFLTELYETARGHLENDQVEATPTFVIGDQRIRGARSADAMAEVIEAELAK